MHKRCLTYKRTHTKRGVELRCKKFGKSGKTLASRQPRCPVGMKRGGASPGLMRGTLDRPSRCYKARKVRY
jgi:hypothetical protein